jgi:hypothetical protein
MNAGWQEWVEAKLPTHQGTAPEGDVKCAGCAA